MAGLSKRMLLWVKTGSARGQRNGNRTWGKNREVFDLEKTNCTLPALSRNSRNARLRLKKIFDEWIMIKKLVSQLIKLEDLKLKRGWWYCGKIVCFIIKIPGSNSASTDPLYENLQFKLLHGQQGNKNWIKWTFAALLLNLFFNYGPTPSSFRAYSLLSFLQHGYNKQLMIISTLRWWDMSLLPGLTQHWEWVLGVHRPLSLNLK